MPAVFWYSQPARDAVGKVAWAAIDALPFAPAKVRRDTGRPGGEQIYRAETYLRSTLLDYGSARIDWSRSRLDGNDLVVPINAKNAFGGYVGYRDYRIPI
jgi:hypothetical protein